jgi:hypothetical protein
MIAALDLLHGRLALGAVLDSQLLFDLLQRLVPARCEIFVLGACHAEMRTVTGGTGRDQAFGAGEDGGRYEAVISVIGGPVDLATVRGRAVSELGWVLAYVRGKGRLEKVLEPCRGEKLLEFWECEDLLAASLVPDA